MTTLDFLKSAQTANENYARALVKYNAALMRADYVGAEALRLEAVSHIEAYLDALASTYKATDGT